MDRNEISPSLELGSSGQSHVYDFPGRFHGFQSSNHDAEEEISIRGNQGIGLIFRIWEFNNQNRNDEIINCVQIPMVRL